METIACLHLIRRREAIQHPQLLDEAYTQAEQLAVKLQAFRKAINPERKWAREERVEYSTSQTDEVP